MPRARKAQTPERSVRNDDYSDREMLANIQDAIGADGWATTTEIALQCGFTGSGQKSQTPAVKVASRLSWMRAGGLLESAEPDYTKPFLEPGARDTRWRLTEAGEMILRGRLSKAVTNAIEGMNPGAQILMMRQLTRQGYIDGALPIAFALRREYQHNISKRKLGIRNTKPS